MQKATKLPSGSWRIRVYAGKNEEGKPVYRSFTAPTKDECEYQAATFKAGYDKTKKDPPKQTVRNVIQKYIDLSPSLSPTTLSSYRKVLDYSFRDIMNKEVSELDTVTMQQAINSEARRTNERTGKQIAPKTVKNEWGLVAAALKTICDMTFNIKLPKTQHNVEELPDPAVIVSIIKGSPVELPCFLAMWMGLRMSEIRGLMCSAIRNGMLYVERVLVDADGIMILKDDAKTQSSKRRIPIPPYIMNLIEGCDSWKSYKTDGKDRTLIEMTRNQIYHYFTRRMKKAEIDISFHDLRHPYVKHTTKIFSLRLKFFQAQPVPDALRKTRGAFLHLREGGSHNPFL